MLGAALVGVVDKFKFPLGGDGGGSGLGGGGDADPAATEVSRTRTAAAAHYGKGVALRKVPTVPFETESRFRAVRVEAWATARAVAFVQSLIVVSPHCVNPFCCEATASVQMTLAESQERDVRVTAAASRQQGEIITRCLNQ